MVIFLAGAPILLEIGGGCYLKLRGVHTNEKAIQLALNVSLYLTTLRYLQKLPISTNISIGR